MSNNKQKIFHLEIDGEHYYFGSPKAIFDTMGPERMGMKYTSFHSNISLKPGDVYKSRRRGWIIRVGLLAQAKTNRGVRRNEAQNYEALPEIEQAIIEQPIIEQPVVEGSFAEQLAFEQPIIEQPAVEGSFAEQFAFEQPSNEQPAVEGNFAEQLAFEQPSNEENVAESLAVETEVLLAPEATLFPDNLESHEPAAEPKSAEQSAVEVAPRRSRKKKHADVPEQLTLF
ncbi:MAG: hypothetical protein KBT12_06520 [Bacteroidales bacterium]|nr:hypothetical protein [Candidatus Physcousia equi]